MSGLYARHCFVVTGTPGVGKSSFARGLAEELGLKYLPLDDMLIKNQLYTGFDKARESYIIDVEAARQYVYENLRLENVVIDSHLAMDIISCEDIDLCIVLRCSPYILVERLRSKGYSGRKVMENVQAEILDVVLTSVLSSCSRDKIAEIDVSEGIDARLMEVAEAIRAGERIRPDVVDWLSLVLSRGDLQRFFPEGMDSGLG